MKLLVLLLAILAGVWLWRRGQRIEPPVSGRPRQRRLQHMVRCPVCGTHVPAEDAVTGQRGSYCSGQHRRDAEGA